MRKLSSYNSIDGFRIMGKITSECNEILKHPKAKEVLKSFSDAQSKTMGEIFMTIINAVFDISPENVLNILACIKCVAKNEVYEQDLITTFDDIAEITKDKPLMDFFSRMLNMGQTTLSDTSQAAEVLSRKQ